LLGILDVASMKIFAISIRNFGIASAALWASLLIYLPPFQSVPGTFGQEHGNSLALLELF